MNRRDRLRAIRQDLAARLESGELARLDAAHPDDQYRARGQEITGAAWHARRLLEDAQRAEETPPGERDAAWRTLALETAADLEDLASWLDG